MRFTIEVEVITLDTRHRQDDGSKVYYALKVPALLDQQGKAAMFRMPEGSYPSNAAFRAWANSQLLQEQQLRGAT